MSMYVLTKLIGKGGFADVWRAVLQGTDKEFAVKKLRDYRNADARKRFVREVEILRGLDHPRVIKLVTANVEIEQPFYVMPLMRGGPLTAHAGRLPADSIRTILVQLADFLAYMHGQGGLHRDIKPDNLLVDAEGNFAVGDFGLGNNPRYTVMMTAGACGTWGYAAPELQLPDGKATPAADIYSLGATMFELMTGIAPKNAPSLDPWAAGAHVAADLRELVLEMVRRDPRTRPTADQILERLGAKAPKKADDGLKALVGIGIAAAIIAALAG